MDSSLFECDSDSDITSSDIEEKILGIIPGVKQSRLASLLQCLKKMGVECVDDLRYLTEKDVTPSLTLIEARKLMDGLKKEAEVSSCKHPARATSPHSPSPSTSSASSEGSHCSLDTTEEASQPIPPVPWLKMPPQLMHALQAKQRPTPSLRKEMVRIIVDNLHRPNKALPRKKVLLAISHQVIKKYPESFIDEVAGETVGSGYESLLSQLINRVDNLKRPTVRKNKLPSLDDTCAPAKKKRDSYGCIHWQPATLPGDETESSQKTTQEELQALHKSEPNTDKAEIVRKMTLTFASQRASINKPDCVLLDIIEEWPYLFDQKCMLLLFSELVGVNIKVKLEQCFQHKIPKLLRFFGSWNDTLHA